jgi:hypothetical protein
VAPETALKAEEARQRADEIRAELEGLLARPGVAPRPNATQWRFLRHCLDALLRGESVDFPCTKSKATQYRFEINERLGRFYARHGDPVKFAFELRHISHAIHAGLVDEDYPCANGYALVISDIRAPYLSAPERETRALLERIIADAGDAEFAVYRALPAIDLAPLAGLFLKEGHAYRRVLHTAEQVHRRNWTISNPNNPSTHRLISVKVVRVGAAEAEVRTEEFWYVRWWSLDKRKNAYVYHERNFHKYLLVREAGPWLIDYDIYPPPRESASRRKWY